MSKHESSCPEVPLKQATLNISENFLENKQACCSLLSVCHLSKTRTPPKKFFRNSAKFRNAYFPEHLSVLLLLENNFPANIYLFKINNRNTKKRCEICPKLTLRTPERRERRRSGVFIVNFEHTSQLFPVFLWLTWNK